LFIHITLETAPNEMQCDETISHMVTAARSYFRTLRNACVTAGKTTMTARKYTMVALKCFPDHTIRQRTL